MQMEGVSLIEMSSIYKEPLRVLKQLFFILTLMFSLVLGASAADAADFAGADAGRQAG